MEGEMEGDLSVYTPKRETVNLAYAEREFEKRVQYRNMASEAYAEREFDETECNEIDKLEPIVTKWKNSKWGFEAFDAIECDP